MNISFITADLCSEDPNLFYLSDKHLCFSSVELMLQKDAKFNSYDFASDTTTRSLRNCSNQKNLLKLITPALPIGVQLDHGEFMFDDHFEQQRASLIESNDYCVTRGWEQYQSDLCLENSTS